MSGQALTDFLLARIAEDEATAREYALGAYSMAGEAVDNFSEVLGEDRAAARVLAECRAKRRIVRLATEGFEYNPNPTLYYLATVYADHPDFREEWRL